MGFLEAVKEAYTRYFDFQGRSPRAGYWWFWLYSTLVSLALMIAGGYFDPNATDMSPLLIGYYLFALVNVIPGIALAVRRLHDSGKSGWWYLIALIPIIGAIWLIVLLVRDSEPGSNQYGPNPYGRGDADVFN